MLTFLDPFLKSWRWPVVALVAALAMLAGAHTFERAFLMLPCPLCLRQREVYWAIAAMAATALILWRLRPNPRFLRAVNIMLGLVFLTGMVVAFYHSGVEYGWWPAPAGCGAQAVDIGAIDLTNLDTPQATASCLDDPFGGKYGLSMAGWNGVISLVLSVLSFRAAGFNRRKLPALSPAE